MHAALDTETAAFRMSSSRLPWWERVAWAGFWADAGVLCSNRCRHHGCDEG